MTRPEEYRLLIGKLYDSWKKKSDDGVINHTENVFIEDGVLCPEQWFSQDIRPLYLLKEAYGWKQDGSLIDDQLMDEKVRLHRIWRNVCEWTEGIFETSKESMPQYRETEYEYYK